VTSFKSKVEQSSLGSRDAQAARKTVPAHQATGAVSRAAALRAAAQKKSSGAGGNSS
jgi:hypothetical protein